MDTFKLVLFSIIFVGLSAICSGLNLAFMSLKVSELKRLAKLGDKRAIKVLPLRQNAHLTLVSILLTNVAVISAFSLTLENRFSGLMAGLISTLLIVIFGEIIPQALFIRSALSVSAILTPILVVMIFFTYPISKPLQLLLDKLLGKERIKLHSRHELGLMFAEHTQDNSNELDEDEVEIIRNALVLSEKRIKSIMTPLKKAYWLNPDTKIDAQKIDDIKRESWSRIPVFNKELTECFGLLLMKDLVDIDFDNHPVIVSDLKLHQTKIIGSMTALDTAFRRFITAHTHLMPVEQNDSIVGIVTIEDLIEEILGHEIEDESDA